MYLLEMKGICKSFGGVSALDHVDLRVKKGEVHALLGENGAGKSTLMKILGGAYIKDKGEIFINNQQISIKNPIESQKKSIAVIYQEQALVECLTVADNIMIGRIPNRKGVIDRRKLSQNALDAMKLVGASFDPACLVRDLSVAQRQFVEIAKAISMDARIIVMDEPTAVLTLEETNILFKLIDKLKEQERSIIYISHRLEELYRIADTCTVLKDGKYIGTLPIEEVTDEKLIKMMTGRDIPDIFPPRGEVGETCFSIENATRRNVFEEISFSIKSGEVIGMSGLVGSGRTEVARAIFGLDSLQKGSIVLDKKELKIRSPMDALREGIVYITEDRKGNGIFTDMAIQDNMTISILGKLSKASFIFKNKERKVVKEMMDKLRVKCRNSVQAIKELSGGNQQKVMFARGLLVDAKVVMIDEPTRGVDVGTKVEIYKIIRQLASEGKAILVISSELPEVMGISDRILVMREGKLVAQVNSLETSEEELLSYAIG